MSPRDSVGIGFGICACLLRSCCHLTVVKLVIVLLSGIYIYSTFYDNSRLIFYFGATNASSRPAFLNSRQQARAAACPFGVTPISPDFPRDVPMSLFASQVRFMGRLRGDFSPMEKRTSGLTQGYLSHHSSISAADP